jgi:hypothetical protein
MILRMNTDHFTKQPGCLGIVKHAHYSRMLQVLLARIFGFTGQLKYKFPLTYSRAESLYAAFVRFLRDPLNAVTYVSSFDTATLVLGIYANRVQ